MLGVTLLERRYPHLVSDRNEMRAVVFETTNTFTV